MIKEYRDKIAEGGCTKTEVTLIGVILLLTGVIIGLLIAPKKIGVYGSFNGNQGSLSTADKDKDE